MTDQAILLAAVSLLFTLVNTAIVATTRAAVAELRADLVTSLPSRRELDQVEDRLARLETRS